MGHNGKNFWQLLYTNDHCLTDTTKDEQWLVLVGRPSLAAISVGGRGRPPHGTEARPTELFSYKSALKKGNFFVGGVLRTLNGA
jgi:hypothetical protein